MFSPDPKLEELYRQADYNIDDAWIKFTIHLGRPNPELQEFLRQRNIDTWAFLTAYNPHSQSASSEQNAASQADLVRALEKHGHRYFHGYGTGENWDPEASLFVCDIERETAVALARKFAQSAILWGQKGHEPELVWCWYGE